jgi:hypothetical protein
MSNESTGRGLFLVFVAFAVAVGVGVAAYNAGVAHGVEQNAKFIAPPAGAQQYVYMYPRPWGFGFGFIFPLILFAILIRGLLWRRHWRGYHGYGYRCGYGPYEREMPPHERTAETKV